MNLNQIRQSLKILTKQKFLLAGSLFCALASVAGTLVCPLLISWAIDRMTGAGKVNFPSVFFLLVCLAVIYLGSNFFLWLLNDLTNRISYLTVSGLRTRLFHKLAGLTLNFYDNQPHGDTISRFVNDADVVSDGLLQGLVALLSGVVTILGSVFFMLRINRLMTLTVALSAPITFFLAKWITSHSRSLFTQNAKILGELNGFAEEMIGGQKTVRAFAHERQSIEQFQKINERLYQTGIRSQFISSLSNPSARIVNNLTYAAVGIIGGLAAISGRITVGGISGFLIYSAIFSKPFNDITGILAQLQSASASARRIFQILDLPDEPPEGSLVPDPTGCKGEIRFEQVDFAYQKDRPLIRNFSLNIKPGSTVAIVGRTGAGKTTLVNLLMRFYDIDGGSIRIDGADIRQMTRSGLRGLFGMVLQDTWLFEGTVRDNIAYAKPDASDSEIIQAAVSAGADGFIRKLPKGYHTVIDGGGDHLSQGQKQLLTIARVMLCDPPILILDEATSSIDTYTEMKIQQAFRKITGGRTSFLIAHRLSTVRSADLILVLDHGSVVESGTHRELLDRGGVYDSLYHSQFSHPENDGAQLQPY